MVVKIKNLLVKDFTILHGLCDSNFMQDRSISRSYGSSNKIAKMCDHNFFPLLNCSPSSVPNFFKT